MYFFALKMEMERQENWSYEGNWSFGGENGSYISDGNNPIIGQSTTTEDTFTTVSLVCIGKYKC
jgi:hypothetical protein